MFSPFCLVPLLPLSQNCAIKELIAPLQRNSNGSWIDVYTKQNVDLNGMWLQGQPNGKNIQNCATFYGDTGRFLDETCSYKSCSVCAWKNEPTFTLRGLCTNTLIDKYYVLLPKLTYNEHVFFFGFGDNNIVYSKKEKSWLIVRDLQSELFQVKIIKEPKKIVGAFKPDRFSNQMPIGMQTWNITDCGGLISLKLSPVSVNIF